jgi:DNA-binding transcriptional regulator YiaG
MANANSDKPAKTVIAKALKMGGGYVAQFALPGLLPDVVSEGGHPKVFYSEDKAVAAANETVVKLLQSRLIDSRRPQETKRITAAEFAVLLAEADITPTWFAEIYGTSQEKVIKWLDGQDDVPHAAYLLVTLMKKPGLLEEMSTLTQARRTPK